MSIERPGRKEEVVMDVIEQRRQRTYTARRVKSVLSRAGWSPSDFLVRSDVGGGARLRQASGHGTIEQATRVLEPAGMRVTQYDWGLYVDTLPANHAR